MVVLGPLVCKMVGAPVSHVRPLGTKPLSRRTRLVERLAPRPQSPWVESEGAELAGGDGIIGLFLFQGATDLSLLQEEELAFHQLGYF